MVNKIDTWIIQETKSKKIIKVIDGSLSVAFSELKKQGDNGKGYSLTSAPMFDNYQGVKYNGSRFCNYYSTSSRTNN